MNKKKWANGQKFFSPSIPDVFSVPYCFTISKTFLRIANSRLPVTVKLHPAINVKNTAQDGYILQLQENTTGSGNVLLVQRANSRTAAASWPPGVLSLPRTTIFKRKFAFWGQEQGLHRETGKHSMAGDSSGSGEHKSQTHSTIILTQTTDGRSGHLLFPLFLGNKDWLTEKN